MNTLKATQMTIQARGSASTSFVGTFKLVSSVYSTFCLCNDQGELRLARMREGSEPRMDTLFDAYTKEGCIIGLRSKANMKFLGVFLRIR